MHKGINIFALGDWQKPSLHGDSMIWSFTK